MSADSPANRPTHPPGASSGPKPENMILSSLTESESEKPEAKATPTMTDVNNVNSTTLKQKSDIHLARKIWHCTGICGIALVYNLCNIRVCMTVLLVVTALFIPLDLLRQRRPGLNKFALGVFGPVMRKHESNNLSGMTYLFVGLIFLMVMNSHYVVTLTLLFLAFGDPVASFFGLRFGKDRILGHKTLQGTLAAFVVCTILAGFYYYFNNLMTERLLIVVPLSGLIGALAELIPIGSLDDNLTFPVVGSCMLWVLFKVYGGFAM